MEKAKIWGRRGRVGEDGGRRPNRCGWRLGGWEVEGKDMDVEVWGKVVGEEVFEGRWDRERRERREREREMLVREESCEKERERVKMVREEGEGPGLEGECKGEGFDDGCGSMKDVREMV